MERILAAPVRMSAHARRSNVMYSRAQPLSDRASNACLFCLLASPPLSARFGRMGRFGARAADSRLKRITWLNSWGRTRLLWMHVQYLDLHLLLTPGTAFRPSACASIPRQTRTPDPRVGIGVAQGSVRHTTHRNPRLGRRERRRRQRRKTRQDRDTSTNTEQPKKLESCAGWAWEHHTGGAPQPPPHHRA